MRICRHVHVHVRQACAFAPKSGRLVVAFGGGAAADALASLGKADGPTTLVEEQPREASDDELSDASTESETSADALSDAGEIEPEMHTSVGSADRDDWLQAGQAAVLQRCARSSACGTPPAEAERM